MRDAPCAGIKHHDEDDPQPRSVGAGGAAERSARERRSIGELASQLLARELREEAQPTPPFSWVSRDLGKPALDLEDKEALRAVLGQ